MEKIFITHYQSPAGELRLGSYRGGLCLCDWMTDGRKDMIDSHICRMLNAVFEEGISEVMENAVRELDEYFAGRRWVFDIPLIFTGTDFQNAARRELLNIPYGQTISYSEQARRIGRPEAVRAVASANATNPISIFVPCHRVIGSDHRLTGYGGGLAAKRFLLDLERQDGH